MDDNGLDESTGDHHPAESGVGGHPIEKGNVRWQQDCYFQDQVRNYAKDNKKYA